MSIKNTIEELKLKLKKWSEEYYVNNNPSVSDAEYDAAYNLLIKLETENPEYFSADSPTQKVGASVDNRFSKVKHQFPMLSLSNAFNEEDLIKFDKQIKDQLGWSQDIKYVIELKIDGLSISVKYKSGKLVQAVTRGNGIQGEDVTHNALKINDIPHTIEYKEDFEVRGEIYMSNEMFEILNDEGESFANPRNAASGTIRQLDSNVAEKRKLNSFMYSIPNPLDHDIHSHYESIKFIAKNKINTNERTYQVNNIVEAIEKVKEITETRSQLNYEIDGIVIKVDDIDKWEDIGYTAKFPKYMIAYKFPEETATTTLEDIFPTVGRTGRITYNAKLSPIRLAGTTVQAATLHNADYIKEINISIGDEVIVKKAGEIIPKVLSVFKKHNDSIWVESKHCPACSNDLVRYEGEVDQYCINEECPQRNIAKLEHFVSRVAMDIEGLSIQTIKTFLDNGIISDIPSIYDIKNKFDEIISLPGFKDKSINNLIESIEKSKTQEMDRFIFGLGIRHVGAKNAKILSRRFGTLDRLIEANIEEIEMIRDLGPKVSKSIIKFFSSEANRHMIERFKSFGLNLRESEAPTSTLFEGLTFVITGTLSKPREEFKSIIEKNGGNVSSSVTSKTNYLLAGEKAGSKSEKAKSLNVKIINEEEFNIMKEGKNG